MGFNKDPREVGPKPPFPKQDQQHPGSVKELNPPADHGEESYTGTGKLEGRVAIITGGDSGIGRAIAIAFSKEGADVTLAYLPEEQDDAQDTARHIEKAGQRSILKPGDITKPDFGPSLVEAAMTEFGHLDIVVNNAAYQMTRHKITDIPEGEFEHTFQTNVFGLYYVTRAALQQMKPGGVVLNTSSIQAFNPSAELLPYAATKAAIANLTKGLAKLAGQQGIRVNAVAPGPVWTPLIPATMDEEKVSSFGQATVFQRPAQPIEIARLFVYLASEEASFISGELYGITGGNTPL